MVFRSKKISIILVLVMIFTTVPAVSFAAQDVDPGNREAQFLDMPDDWSTSALNNAVRNGLLSGDGGLIKANDYLTRAQMATIMNRVFGTIGLASLKNYQDVNNNAWYYADMKKAVYMKTFIGYDSKLNPDSNITREEVITVLANVLKLSGASEHALEIFSDKDSVSPWAKDAAASIVEAGYITGSEGNLNPRQSITRAEFAQVMDNIIKHYITEPGIYTENITGNLMINVPGVTLKDIKVEGDLIIGDGVGDGDITLDGVNVTGRVVIRGGGVNSIRIIGQSDIENIIIARVHGQTRVFSADGIEIGDVIVDGNDDAIVEGEFGKITLVASDITVIAKCASIATAVVEGNNSKIIFSTESAVDKVVIEGENTEINVEEGSEIETLVVEGSGAGISGEGEVSTVQANADDVTISTSGTTVEAAVGIQGVIAGGKTVAAGTTENVGSTDTKKKSVRRNRTSTTTPLSSYTQIALMQTGTVAEDNVQYGTASAVIAALPAEITVTLENSEVVDVPLMWTDTDVYNSAKSGDYTFTADWGEMPASANNDRNLAAPVVEVTVSAGAIESSSLSSYTQITLNQTGTIADDDVQYATAAAVITALPTEIAVTLENSEVVDVPVTWTDSDTYNSTSAGDYTFTATWGEMPASANNDRNRVAPVVEVTVSAGALQETAGNYFTFDKFTGTITDYDQSGGLQVLIPRVIEGVEVKVIGEEAFSSKTITSIEIPNSVTEIRKEAFAYCNSLKTVTIPDSVITMGDSAFSYCQSLEKIDIPDHLTEIPTAAFSYCSALTTADIPNGVTTILDSAFESCISLKALVIPASVITIEDNAFYDCQSLTTLDLPENGLFIDYGAFQQCVGLETVTVSSKVNLGYGVFQNCDGLKTVVVDSEAIIGYGAFQYCDELETVTIRQNADIGYGAFQYCDKLKTAHIGDEAVIGYGVFQYCKVFESIVAGNGVSIGNFVSSGSTTLSNITVGDDSRIEAWAFTNCRALTSITIGERTSVDSLAFDNPFYMDFTDPVEGGAGTYLYDAENFAWIKQ